MKKFLKALAVILAIGLAIAGIAKIMLSVIPEVDDDVESINTTGREYITL